MPQPKKPAQATRGKLTEVTIALMRSGDPHPAHQHEPDG